MLFQDEIVDRVLSGMGQVILTPFDLGMTEADISRKFFIPIVRQYERYRPNEVTEEINVSSGSMVLPQGFRKELSLSNIMSYQGVVVPFLAVSPIRWEIRNGILYCPSGRFQFKYHKSFTLTKDVTNWVIEPGAASGIVYLKFPRNVTPGSITLSSGVDPNPIYTATIDADAAISGTLVDGNSESSFDPATGECTFTLAQPTTAPILTTFHLRYPCVVEIDYQDDLFYDFFCWKFLMGWANTKAQLQLEGMPVNVNLDDILSYAREREQAFTTTSLETRQKWYSFM